MAYKDKYIVFKTNNIKWSIGTDDRQEFEIREIDISTEEHDREITNVQAGDVLNFIRNKNVRPYLYAKVQQFLFSIA